MHVRGRIFGKGPEQDTYHACKDFTYVGCSEPKTHPLLTWVSQATQTNAFNILGTRPSLTARPLRPGDHAFVESGGESCNAAAPKTVPRSCPPHDDHSPPAQKIKSARVHEQTKTIRSKLLRSCRTYKAGTESLSSLLLAGKYCLACRAAPFVEQSLSSGVIKALRNAATSLQSS